MLKWQLKSNHISWSEIELRIFGFETSKVASLVKFFSNVMLSNDELILYFCDNKVLIGRKKMSKLCRCQKYTRKWADKCFIQIHKKSVKEFENNRWLGSSWSLNFFSQTQVAWTGQTFWRRCPLFYINLFVDE